MTYPLRVIIADDEPLARRTLDRLASGVDRLEVVAEACDGMEALHLIDQIEPDLVFLDIRMPGISGIDVVRRARHRPGIIFTTAFDTFAVTAFELQAIDYLLKPFGRRRFETAVGRFIPGLQDIPERAQVALDEAPLQRLFARERGSLIPIRTRDILRIDACDDYARIVTPSTEHLIHVRMKDLERHLDSGFFVRVHRSHIINLDAVERIDPLPGGRAEVILSEGTSVPVSRTGIRTLKDGAYWPK